MHILSAKQAGWVASAALALGTVACGGGPANDLSREEAYQVSQPVSQNGASVPVGSGSFISVSIGIDEKEACPDGGEIHFHGSMNANIDENDGSGTVGVDASADYLGCTYELNTLDGSLRQVMAMSNTGEDFQLSVDITGGIWVTGDVEGSCSVNLHMELDASSGGGDFDGSGSISGDFCGYDIEELTAEFSGSAS